MGGGNAALASPSPVRSGANGVFGRGGGGGSAIQGPSPSLISIGGQGGAGVVILKWT